MSAWILICPKCKTEFQHSQINDTGMSSLHNLYLPAKPDFAPNGNACACPNCGHSALYRRTDLLYRA
jgi:predicted nucleic-acid-binding Zn-ribbon protein